MLFTLATAASLIASAAAHATWQEFWIGDVDAGSSCVRLPVSNSPVTDVTSDDIACNAGATASAGVCSVTVEMHQQPNARSCANEAIGGNHYGPVIVYMAAVDDATAAVGSDAAWFKVSESGLVSNNPDCFGNRKTIVVHYTFKIPSDVAPGNYLLRAETIALHVASGVNGAQTRQILMSCYQINVSGSGTATPDTVSLPGAYSAEDPGILINIYTQLNTYTVPGPTLYGTTEAAVATTSYATSATWNTASQPSTVPTTVPASS
ncbi:glycosyl hydrolase family 61-domain-containing protein [Armillaria luteobubalina]|uniref:AA9 family lytic polysaccharide monooxygenase n=1 Tax=Armillaria luteobubalina TaxID=153913 RepID=A0AA39UNT6_9AGAR|nr:glycosyl hydrolase family 61-domain-containing protein [Armillaria luteobubalina]